jgi:microcystin degradation protein MlrC
MVQLGAVILEVGSIKLLISEGRTPAGKHPDVYRHFGIEPAEARIIVMKTGTNFQYYESMAKKILRVDCPGFAQADLAKFEWKRAPRPIYPIDKDKMDDWKAVPKVKA